MAVLSFTGLLGSGKTYSMVKSARDLMKKGKAKTVYTNMASLRFPNSHYIRSIEEVYGLENGLIVLDEAHIWMPSRFWQSMPREFCYKLSMMRHFGLEMMYTTQAIERVDKILREITSYQVRCRYFSFLKLFLSVTWEPYTKEVIGRQFHKLDSSVYSLYDTMEIVVLPDEQKDSTSSLVMTAKHGRTREGVKAAASPQRTTWHLTRDEQAVKSWLEKRGLIETRGLHPKKWIRLVESEVRRVRWLKSFGLSPDDVPFSCTSEYPWVSPPPELQPPANDLLVPAGLDLSADQQTIAASASDTAPFFCMG